MRVRSVTRWVWRTQMDGATGALGEAPHEATKRVMGVPKCVADACGRCHWGLGWRSLVGPRSV
eukprot:1222431-Pyramimonas_sp.AAC.1